MASTTFAGGAQDFLDQRVTERRLAEIQAAEIARSQALTRQGDERNRLFGRQIDATENSTALRQLLALQEAEQAQRLQGEKSKFGEMIGNIGNLPARPISGVAEATPEKMGIIGLKAGPLKGGPSKPELVQQAIRADEPVSSVNAVFEDEDGPSLPNSLGAAFTQRFLGENPNATSEDILGAHAEFSSMRRDPTTQAINELRLEMQRRDAQAQMTPAQRTAAFQLANDFDNQSEDFVTRAQSYDTIRAIASGTPSAAGDISMVFAFMKMLDPQSVVREGEQATAAQARGVPDSILNIYNRVVDGRRLTDDQIADFFNQATQQFEAARRRQRSIVDQFTRKAQRFSVPPEAFITDYEALFELEDDASAASSPGQTGSRFSVEVVQ